MNLLYEFLKNLPAADLEKLENVAERGVAAQLWTLLLQWENKTTFDRDFLLQKLNISPSHFDKVSSLLLSKSYTVLFGKNDMALLEYLSKRPPFVKHYYHELKKQIKRAEKNFSRKELLQFYLTNVSYIQLNMSIISIDERLMLELADRYLSLEKNKNARLLMQTKLLYVKIAKLFAASKIQDNQMTLQKEVDVIFLPKDADEELVFSHYWLKIYFYHASENFSACEQVLKKAIRQLGAFKTEKSKIRTYQMKLKLAEILYFMSNFHGSFSHYAKLVVSPYADKIPDYSYHITKYLQICLIVAEWNEAERLVKEQILSDTALSKEALQPRDVISLAKFYLFKSEYATAFEFILLGFEKNPKGKYFQYEIELRNLQTACFYLDGQRDLALKMCNTHIRFLAAHGYTTDKSNFPHYYLLIKAIHKHKRARQPMAEQDQAMLDRYQKGSYAVYGKLLLAILKA